MKLKMGQPPIFWCSGRGLTGRVLEGCLRRAALAKTGHNYRKNKEALQGRGLEQVELDGATESKPAGLHRDCTLGAA